LTYGDNGPFPYNTTTNGYVGNSISNPYDGSNLVSYGHVVLVVVNYRLSAFGWFNGKNEAVRDALLSLQWVKENIAAFGGDVSAFLFIFLFN
jgi:carboxylesterase type B